MHETIIGNAYGHWLRRLVHVAILLIPIIYYWYGPNLQQWLGITPDQIISLIVMLAVIFEIIRLRNGWLILGQRHYEKNHVSAFAWTVMSTGLVLLIAPKIGQHHAAIGLPLLWSLAFADPIMGELRRAVVGPGWVFFIGIVIVLLVWLAGYFWLGSPWYLLPIVVPVTVAAEWIKSNTIDDNALMLLVPLACIILLLPWH